MTLVVKNLPANIEDIRDVHSIPGLGRSLGGGHGNPLQYSCLENPTDRGAWRAIVHKVAKSRTWLKWLNMVLLQQMRKCIGKYVNYKYCRILAIIFYFYFQPILSIFPHIYVLIFYYHRITMWCKIFSTIIISQIKYNQCSA